MSKASSAHYFADWPGKSAPIDGGREHPAACHMLDVAAVAEVLLATRDPGLPPGQRDLFCLLVALHDLGKIGRQFRATTRGRAAQSWRHWRGPIRRLADGPLTKAYLNRLTPIPAAA